MLKSILVKLRSNDSERPRPPWVTYWTTAICVAIFVGISVEDHLDGKTLAKWGYVSAQGVWEGSIWGLLTSTLIHIMPWHLAFNAYWLMIIGTRIESELKSWRFLILMLTSAFVSSALQMTLGDETGIGASGIGYALFGFAWMLRDRVPNYAAVLTNQNVRIFIIWLFGCLITTYLGIFSVANIAHFGGLGFGVAIAYCFVRRDHLKMAVPLLSSLLIFSIVPLFWCPWSVTWLCVKAYEAHAALRLEKAVYYYDKILKAEPTHAWASQNRELILSSQNRSQQKNND